METVPEDETDDTELFALARSVKSFAHEHGAYSLGELRAIHDRWHEVSKALLPLKLQDGEFCFAAFLKAFGNVKYLQGERVLENAWERTLCPPPPGLAGILSQCLSPDAPLCRLAHLCLELQRGFGEQPFFLSCRTVGRLFGAGPATASTWLRSLEVMGIIETVKKGQRGAGGAATRFRYRLPMEEHTPCRKTFTGDVHREAQE